MHRMITISTKSQCVSLKSEFVYVGKIFKKLFRRPRKRKTVAKRYCHSNISGYFITPEREMSLDVDGRQAEKTSN